MKRLLGAVVVLIGLHASLMFATTTGRPFFVTVLIACVAVIFRRRVSMAVAHARWMLKSWRRFGFDDGNRVRRIYACWAEVSRSCGLSTRVLGLPGDVPVDEVPRLAGPISVDDLGNVSFIFSLNSGQTLGEWVAKSQAMAEAWRVPAVRVERHAPGRVRLTVVIDDPLDHSTTLSTPPVNVEESGVNVELGTLESGEPWVHDFNDATHLVLQGQTRSGKSMLTYGLLSGLAGRRDVLLCGIDPTRVVLNPWKDHPGADLRVTGEDPVGAAEVLRRLTEIMHARLDELDELGDRDKVSEATPETPLLILVLEEYTGLLRMARLDDDLNGRKPSERVAKVILACVESLVMEGAKVGIRVVMLVQRASADAINSDVRANFGTRISMRVGDPASVTMLHPRAPVDVPERMGEVSQGVAFVDAPGSPGRWAKAHLTEYRDYVARVRGANASFETAP